ncbi:hypothetical protein DFH06DRAFT_106243 [Mycena polygramma]|nr:hypothetical protein DFH06DRAFT_106243 [Mycena polygramma]
MVVRWYSVRTGRGLQDSRRCEPRKNDGTRMVVEREGRTGARPPPIKSPWERAPPALTRSAIVSFTLPRTPKCSGRSLSSLLRAVLGILSPPGQNLRSPVKFRHKSSSRFWVSRPMSSLPLPPSSPLLELLRHSGCLVTSSRARRLFGICTCTYSHEGLRLRTATRARDAIWAFARRLNSHRGIVRQRERGRYPASVDAHLFSK